MNYVLVIRARSWNFFIRIVLTSIGIIVCTFFRRIFVTRSQFPKAENMFAVGMEYLQNWAGVSMSITVYSGLQEVAEGFEEEIPRDEDEEELGPVWRVRGILWL